jgi:hypothetical protein
MPQTSREVVLMRQLVSCLAMPILLVDPVGTLLFYNEPAEGFCQISRQTAFLGWDVNPSPPSRGA